MHGTILCTVPCYIAQGHMKLLKIGGAEYIIRIDLYGEKLQSYGVTVKVGGL